MIASIEVDAALSEQISYYSHNAIVHLRWQIERVAAESDCEQVLRRLFRILGHLSLNAKLKQGFFEPQTCTACGTDCMTQKDSLAKFLASYLQPATDASVRLELYWILASLFAADRSDWITQLFELDIPVRLSKLLLQEIRTQVTHSAP